MEDGRAGESFRSGVTVDVAHLRDVEAEVDESSTSQRRQDCCSRSMRSEPCWGRSGRVSRSHHQSHRPTPSQQRGWSSRRSRHYQAAIKRSSTLPSRHWKPTIRRSARAWVTTSTTRTPREAHFSERDHRIVAGYGWLSKIVSRDILNPAPALDQPEAVALVRGQSRRQADARAVARGLRQRVLSSTLAGLPRAARGLELTRPDARDEAAR